MAVNLRRNIVLKGLTPDEAIFINDRMSNNPKWKGIALRMLKARRLPWRAEVTNEGLHFVGFALWPSQRTYIANRMRSIIRDTARFVKGTSNKKESKKRARKLRMFLSDARAKRKL